MHPRHVPAALLAQLVLDIDGTAVVRFSSIIAGAAFVASMLTPAAASAQTSEWTRLYEHVQFVQGYIVQLVLAGYQQAPALVLVLSALLVVPALVILTLLIQGVMRFFSWRRRRRPAPYPLPEIDWTRDSTPRTDVPSWPAQAWLTVDDDVHAKLSIDAEVVSIGRHEDNVLALDDISVHRFHAVIHRNDDSQFIITDLTGEEGNGVRINGERQLRAPLVDGDLIELGRARLTFAAVPH